MIKEHSFTHEIKLILQQEFNGIYLEIFNRSNLLQYLNYKTKSASKGSKSRSSFANIFAIYVLVEDYIKNSRDYSTYEGAHYSNLLKRLRELPFGEKLQNHALNHRLNQEFLKQFPNDDSPVILRNPVTAKYWINENLLLINLNGQSFNISHAILQIIERYIEVKQESFKLFIQNLQLINTDLGDPNAIENLLQPNIDARIFEIVSFSILKYYYIDRVIYWGWDPDELKEDYLKLYKTGRTNANDGGIDFVMQPLGRFFQVTETTDVNKFFLDIDKVQRYPITFVVKSNDSVEELKQAMELKAREKYPVENIVQTYMKCIEEIINVPILLEYLKRCSYQLDDIINEIIIQSKLEFNQ